MSDTASFDQPNRQGLASVPPGVSVTGENYLNASHGPASWLLTTDHKRIGVLFLLAILFFFALATISAAFMRMELITPQSDLLRPETYNKLFTMHGVLMVWFFLIPSIPSVLGNFIIPLMIGARDLAFPRLNLLSWYLFVTGGALVCYSIIVGGVDTGWTFYTPYSTIYSNTHVLTMVLGIFLAGFSSILTGLNFIVTIHKLRAPGLTWGKLPLFIWSLYATSIMLVLATPILGITLLLIVTERIWRLGIFDPALGGDPVLFQHLFWFYSHPAVYIMILPGMGVVSELITCFSRQRIFGYWFVAASSLAIGFLSFLVWGHHLFVAGQSVYAGLMFSMLSYLVAVPSSIKVFNWVATLHRGSISFETPMLYALAFIGLFTIGGMTGLFIAAIPVDVHVTDTYFIVAHFHFIMVGGMMMGFLGGLHYWWPKMTGRRYPERLGQLAALVTYIGFYLTFFPMFWMGWLGMPRRYASYPPDFQIYHILASAGASVLGSGYLLTAGYLCWSLRHGKPAPANPWRATGLEWLTSSPPPKLNFPVPPVVTLPPYSYDPAAEEELLAEEALQIQTVKARLRPRTSPLRENSDDR